MTHTIVNYSLTASLLSSVRLSPSDESASAARWEHWRPWCALDARKRRDSEGNRGADYEYVERHRLAVRACRIQKISWAVIRRHNLDDPRLDDPSRDEQIRLAIKRRWDKMPRRRKKEIVRNANRTRTSPE